MVLIGLKSRGFYPVRKAIRLLLGSSDIVQDVKGKGLAYVANTVLTITFTICRLTSTGIQQNVP